VLWKGSHGQHWEGVAIICSVPSNSVLRFLLWPSPSSSSFPPSHNKKQQTTSRVLADIPTDLADQTISLRICCPITLVLVLYKHYGLHDLRFWDSWPFSECRQMWTSVITLNQSAIMRKPFRIVLTALLANRITNLFYKHHIKWHRE
jgi:hypothetical protein